MLGGQCRLATDLNCKEYGYQYSNTSSTQHSMYMHLFFDQTLCLYFFAFLGGQMGTVWNLNEPMNRTVSALPRWPFRSVAVSDPFPGSFSGQPGAPRHELHAAAHSRWATGPRRVVEARTRATAGGLSSFSSAFWYLTLVEVFFLDNTLVKALSPPSSCKWISE